MGQSQSNTAAAIDVTSKENPKPSSMESRIAEAVAYGGDENESIDAKAAKALECPCIADLREGSCGSQFSEAFLCFLKSSAHEKGSDCVSPFVALQKCVKAYPDAFPKDINEDEQDSNSEARILRVRMAPPTWSEESQGPKPRL